MTNPLYSHATSAPIAQSRGTSSAMRGEFDAIASAFDKVSNSIMAGATESGSASNFLITLTPQPAVMPAKGTFYFQATHSNVGASTLQVGTFAAVPLLANDGTPLGSGAISAGTIVCTYFDGTNAYLLGPTKAYADGLSFSSSLPAQAGNAGKFITTNGESASWVALSFGAGTLAAPALTVTDAGTGFYRPGLNQIALGVNGVLMELNQSTGKTISGNLVFGTGVTFPANMATSQLLALTGAPRADGTGASGTWGISISGSAASATSAGTATTAGSAGISTNLSGITPWSIPYQSAPGITSYVAPGTAGQLLSTGGPSAAPSWMDPPPSGFSGFANFTTVGATNWTVPAGVTKVRATVVSGGGGGRNAHTQGGGGSLPTARGAAGGSGGVAQGYITGLTPGSTISITVGAGGAVGVNGGQSSFGTHLVVSGGGAGGFNGAGVAAAGGAVGVASGTTTFTQIPFKALVGQAGEVVDGGNGYLGSTIGGNNTFSNYGTGGNGGGARWDPITYGGSAGTQGCIVVEF